MNTYHGGKTVTEESCMWDLWRDSAKARRKHDKQKCDQSGL